MREYKKKKTTQSTKGYEKVLQARLKREQRGSPLSLELSINNFEVYIDMCKAFRLHYDIGENSVKMLVLLYSKWINKSDGMSLHELACRVYSPVESSKSVQMLIYEKTRQAINRLISLGLVELIALRSGVARSVVRIFAPTVKLLREFGAFVKRFSVSGVPAMC